MSLAEMADDRQVEYRGAQSGMPVAGLRRELAAIATLYVVLCALPLLIGLWLGV